MKASIVIPVYNGMPYVVDALASALAQGVPGLEVVVIENGSTDGTREWLRTVDDARVRVVWRDATQPPGDNWTQAIAESRGDFVKLMCADDLIEPGSLRRQIAELERTEAVMAACRRRIVDPTGRTIRARHGLGRLSGVIDGAEAIRACCLAGTNVLGEPAAVLFRGDAIRASMPWDGRLPYMIDLATYAKVLRGGSVVCVPDVLASFRVSATSWSAQLLRDQPHQFRSWRAQTIRDLSLPWGPAESLRAELALRARTAARRAAFAVAARRASG